MSGAVRCKQHPLFFLPAWVDGKYAPNLTCTHESNEGMPNHSKSCILIMKHFQIKNCRSPENAGEA